MEMILESLGLKICGGMLWYMTWHWTVRGSALATMMVRGKTPEWMGHSAGVRLMFIFFLLIAAVSVDQVAVATLEQHKPEWLSYYTSVRIELETLLSNLRSK